MSARTPSREISSRREGANAPRPPSNMAMDERFAKPQSAKITMACEMGDIEALTSEYATYATNSLSITAPKVPIKSDNLATFSQ